MRNRSLTRIALRFLLGAAGASLGKNFSTSSSRLNLPSSMASPTAVDVKLLLSEKREWGASALYGAHQPSATTWPWRTSMKLFINSIFVSAASTNDRRADEETPCASGLLRGKPPATAGATKAKSATIESAFIIEPQESPGSLGLTEAPIFPDP